MAQDVQRFEVKLRSRFKAKVVKKAALEGVPVGEMIVRLAARALRFPEDEAVPMRKTAGRKPTVDLSGPVCAKCGEDRIDPKHGRCPSCQGRRVECDRCGQLVAWSNWNNEASMCNNCWKVTIKQMP
jgi:hypothetical protein